LSKCHKNPARPDVPTYKREQGIAKTLLVIM